MTLEDAPVSVARKARFRKKSRPFAQPPGGSVETESSTVAAVQTATAYRTFSRKLPAVLLGTGGGLAFIGALGQWVRATQVASVGLAPEEVRAVMGYAEPAGIVIAIVSVLAIVLALGWLQTKPIFRFLRPAGTKVASAFNTIFLVALVGWQVPVADDRAAAMAKEARDGSLDFLTFHAGLGWGAWCLVVAATLSVLGLLAGLMREVDVKRGISE